MSVNTVYRSGPMNTMQRAINSCEFAIAQLANALASGEITIGQIQLWNTAANGADGPANAGLFTNDATFLTAIAAAVVNRNPDAVGSLRAGQPGQGA